MKFSSLQENLKQGMFIVGHVAGKNINLPILGNVMIETKNGDIKLITTDLELGIINKIRGKIEKEGSFTINSKIFYDYISLLPNKKIEIEQKENNLIIKTEKYNTKIAGQSIEEFPLIPRIEKNSYISLNIKEFKKAVAQIIFAVSANESRIELSGIFFNINKNRLTMAATDSYRLAEKEIRINAGLEEENKSIIIPAKTLQELIRILSAEQDIVGEDNGEIKIYLSESQILFTFRLTELISRLIEGQYPDYKQIIPPQGKTKAIVDRQELLRAVKASSLFSKTGINDINLDFPSGQNKAIISSTSGMVGENIAEIDARVSGEDNGIVVNYRYLLDGLNNIDSENIIIEVIDNNTPCIIRPEKEEGYLYIIMPIKQ